SATGGGSRSGYWLRRALRPDHCAFQRSSRPWRAGTRQNRRHVMSFSERPSRARNRRLSNVRQRRQQHLLDVKVRSRRATQHRIRSAMGVLWKMIAIAALSAGIYLGAREAARRLFFDNPDYRVKTIAFQTDGTLQREEVLNAAELHEGANIFSVNLARI